MAIYGSLAMFIISLILLAIAILVLIVGSILYLKISKKHNLKKVKLANDYFKSKIEEYQSRLPEWKIEYRFEYGKYENVLNSFDKVEINKNQKK